MIVGLRALEVEILDAEGKRVITHPRFYGDKRAAVAGMLEILESTGGTDRAGVCLAAARHASGLGPVAYDDPVDLSEYDIAYTKEDE